MNNQKDITIIQAEKLRSLLEVITALKQQVFQLETIIKEMRNNLIK